MKPREVISPCLNCGCKVENDTMYCPKCGQDTATRKVPLKHILSDFLGDYFTFDSKLFKSIVPLLFMPGKLTNEYNAGKRASHIPPLRIYIFVSFIYFLLAGLTSGSDSDDTEVKDSNKKDTMAVMADSSKHLSKNNFNVDLKGGVVKMDYQGEDSSFPFDTLEKIISSDEKIGLMLDSIGIGQSPTKIFFAKIAIAQTIKLKKQQESFKSYFLRNVSILMFFLMPFFATLLKIFYYKKKIFYIEHLIFSFHFHTFVFLALLVSSLIDFDSVRLVVILLMLVYLIIALKRVYRQSLRKTIFKTVLLCMSYLVSLFCGMLATIVVTFLFF